MVVTSPAEMKKKWSWWCISYMRVFKAGTCWQTGPTGFQFTCCTGLNEFCEVQNEKAPVTAAHSSGQVKRPELIISDQDGSVSLKAQNKIWWSTETFTCSGEETGRCQHWGTKRNLRVTLCLLSNSSHSMTQNNPPGQTGSEGCWNRSFMLCLYWVVVMGGAKGADGGSWFSSRTSVCGRRDANWNHIYWWWRDFNFKWLL